VKPDTLLSEGRWIHKTFCTKHIILTTGRMIHSGTNKSTSQGIDPVTEILTAGRMIPSGTNSQLAEISTQ
jgi:hypothetical protein